MCEAMALAFLLCPDFIEVSLAVHSYRSDQPEITGLGNPLFIGSLNWHVYQADKKELNIFVEHTSGITTFEQGYGLNTIGVRYRYSGK